MHEDAMDMKKMRRHLLLCLESGELTRFPTIGERRIRFGTRVRKSFNYSIFSIIAYFGTPIATQGRHKGGENVPKVSDNRVDLMQRMPNLTNVSGSHLYDEGREVTGEISTHTRASA